MLSSLKEKFKKNDKMKPEKASWIQTLSVREKVIAGTTAGLAVISLGGLMMFNPGIISGMPKHDNPSVTLPQVTKNIGPVQMLNNKPAAKQADSPTSFNMPASIPGISNMFGGAHIPARLPGFNPPSASVPLPGSISMPGMKPAGLATPEYMKKAYAVHAAMSSSMKGVLDDTFTLANMSDAPSGAGANRFLTTYVAKNGSDTVLASDALYSLVEDSSSVNIIEDGGSYLVFDIAGSKGYQLTKVAVSDDAITFAAYVNLTTNLMPSALKDEWIGKLKSF